MERHGTSRVQDIWIRDWWPDGEPSAREKEEGTGEEAETADRGAQVDEPDVAGFAVVGTIFDATADTPNAIDPPG